MIIKIVKTVNYCSFDNIRIVKMVMIAKTVL